MTEMVERVARALFQRDVEEDVCDGAWEDNPALHERILADARAAIAAMRDPAQRARTDLVDRLRSDGSSWAQSLFNEAADEIERLRAQSWKYLQEVGVQARRADGVAQAPRQAWLDLANYLERARGAYLNSIGTPFAKANKAALESVLWDDKATFIEALRSGSSLPSTQSGDGK